MRELITVLLPIMSLLVLFAYFVSDEHSLWDFITRVFLNLVKTSVEGRRRWRHPICGAPVDNRES